MDTNQKSVDAAKHDRKNIVAMVTATHSDKTDISAIMDIWISVQSKETFSKVVLWIYMFFKDKPKTVI